MAGIVNENARNTILHDYIETINWYKSQRFEQTIQNKLA